MKKSKPTLWGLNLLFFILLLENVGKLFHFSIIGQDFHITDFLWMLYRFMMVLICGFLLYKNLKKPKTL